MFADTNGAGERIAEHSGRPPYRGFGASLTPTPVIHELNKCVAPDIRIGSQSAWSQLVLALDNNNRLARSDWAASREPAHVGLRALQRIVQQRVGKLKRLVCCLQFDGLLDLRRDHQESEAANFLRNLDLDASRDYLVFSLIAGELPEVFTLQRHITQLERAAPGLGSAVLHWIACAGWRTVSVGTPEYVLHMVGIEQWMGCENEEEVIEMWRLEGMHEEDIQQTEMIRRADLDAQFPAHVLRPDSKFSRRHIETLLTHRQRWIKEVARSLLEIVDLVQCKNARLLTTQGIDVDQIYVGALLRWNDRDMSVRVYDNFINYYMQGDGYTELQGVEAVPTDPVAVSQFFKRLEDGLQLLTALDRLIALVTRPQREERSNDNYDDDDSNG